MDFFKKLNSKNTFGMLEQNKNNNIINIICGVLLIILIIVLIICLVKKDKFSNQKEDDVHLFQVVNNLDTNKDPCPYSRKMTALLEKNNNMIGKSKVKKITIKDPLAIKYGIKGTPSIICIRSNKVSVGFKPLEKVEEDLKDKNNYGSNGSNKPQKDILLIGYMGCPFCQKAKKLMDELQIDYDFVESNSDLGNGIMAETGATGVPLIKHSNGHISRFNEQEIRNLKN